jgi:hypothetical protein
LRDMHLNTTSTRANSKMYSIIYFGKRTEII